MDIENNIFLQLVGYATGWWGSTIVLPGTNQYRRQPNIFSVPVDYFRISRIYIYL